MIVSFAPVSLVPRRLFISATGVCVKLSVAAYRNQIELTWNSHGASPIWSGIIVRVLPIVHPADRNAAAVRQAVIRDSRIIIGSVIQPEDRSRPISVRIQAPVAALNDPTNHDADPPTGTPLFKLTAHTHFLFENAIYGKLKTDPGISHLTPVPCARACCRTDPNRLQFLRFVEL